MPLKNSPTTYGTVTRAFHWSIALLVAWQFFGANLMTRLAKGVSFLGLDGNGWYNAHKSIGLVLLALVLGRWIWRKTTPLPWWHPSLTKPERRIVGKLETGLYLGMFLLPVTGYLYVMAGGYGIELFGAWTLPNPIGKQPGWSWLAWTAHVVLAYVLLVLIAWHIGFVLKKQFSEKSGVLERMLPFKR